MPCLMPGCNMGLDTKVSPVYWCVQKQFVSNVFRLTVLTACHCLIYHSRCCRITDSRYLGRCTACCPLRRRRGPATVAAVGASRGSRLTDSYVCVPLGVANVTAEGGRLGSFMLLSSDWRVAFATASECLTHFDIAFFLNWAVDNSAPN
jgi:hypothetical protein